MWSQHSAKEWKHNVDELVSANILLNKLRSPEPTTGLNKGRYSVEPIPLALEHSFTAIAFALPKLLHEMGGHIQELSLDLACMSFFFSPSVHTLINLHREHQQILI
jgi:hypothetical protein